MFSRRGYDVQSPADAGPVHCDKRRPQVATDSDDGVEPLNVEKYCAVDEDWREDGSHESLRAAIASGVKGRDARACDCGFKGWLSTHGLIIGKVLLFLILLTATVVVTALSVRASELRDAAASAAVGETSLLIAGETATAFTSCGPVQGWVEDGAYSFRGIPYALPPEGERRWQLPVPLHRLEYCWNGTLETARSTPNACWQTYRNGSLDGAEDCLTLDVFAPPTNRSQGPRPPVVVLAAAEALSGAGDGRAARSAPLLGAALARTTGVLFVRVRFRLGVLGFLATTRPPSLGGNFGLADLRLALLWVRDNAAAFGGDPSAVTLLGHRAGASLALALASDAPAKRRLFAKVWLSGPAPPSEDAEGSSLARRRGDAFVDGLECSSEEGEEKGSSPGRRRECWRTMDAEDLVEAAPEEWKWRAVDLPGPGDTHASWLTVDGRVLKRSPLEALRADGVRVPMVIGTTSHGESSPELIQRRDWVVPGAIQAHVQRSAVGAAGLAPDAMRLYSTPSDSLISALAAMVTDIRSICPLLRMARSVSSSAATPVFFYVAEASPGERGDPGEHIGPGTDLEEILQDPVAKPEVEHGAMARLFYAFVRHSFVGGEEGPFLAPAPWSRVPAMPFRVLLAKRDGQVATNDSVYSTCEFWERQGFTDPQFAKWD